MATYEPITSIQITSASSTIDIGSIPQIYKDLKIVLRGKGTGGTGNASLRFNGNSSSLYSRVRFLSSGGAPSTERMTSDNNLDFGDIGGFEFLGLIHILDYSNTTTFKNIISRFNTEDYISMYAGVWQNTSAINSIQIIAPAAMQSGTTVDIYGLSSVAASTPQAFGGTDIYYDTSYVYHVFKDSGSFIPARNITADILSIAGGGGGGGGGSGATNGRGGGGGAGGVVYSSNQSLLANTTYPVLVGAGGSGGSNTITTGKGNGLYYGSDGQNSRFGSLTTAIGGGGGGSGNNTATFTSTNNGRSGGSGGGAATYYGAGTAGTGNVGQGNNGGGGTEAAPNYGSGGGGGAGAVGGSGTSTTAGNGGAGTSTYSSWANSTSTGVAGYYAGGGGGTTYGGNPGNGGAGGGSNGAVGADAPDAITNTGGGGGGAIDGWGGGSGGSGIVIVRYPR